MKTRRAFACSAAMAFFITPAIAAEPHAAAPMMAPATGNAPWTEQAFHARAKGPGRTLSEGAILAGFRTRYSASPRIVVLADAPLSRQVSDWHSRARLTSNSRAEIAYLDDDGRHAAIARQSDATQLETRGARSPRHYETARLFGIRSGITDALRSAGAIIVDEGLAERLTDNALEDGGFSRLSPDQLRLQTRMLAEHADYVLELTPQPASAPGSSYRVRVLSVENASLLANFASDGRPPIDASNSAWVATSHGYEKREREPSAADIGRELALQAMQHMQR